MKKIILNLATCIIISSGLAVNAQDQESNYKDSPLVGIWTLEKQFMDNAGNKFNVYPGNFMIINSDGNFTFFLFSPQGSHIYNEGRITYEADNIYIETIDFNTNRSLVGQKAKIKIQLIGNRLHKSVVFENNIQETEVWRKVERPVIF